MSLAAPSFMPNGWPVIERGLLMAYVGPIMVIRIGSVFPDASFERYLEEWKRSVEGRPRDASVFALYDIPIWPGMQPVQRRRWSEMLKRHEGRLRTTTRGMALATPSALTRGAARAVFWFAPPPYPHVVVDTPEAAFVHLASLGAPPAAATRVMYRATVERHWPSAERPTSLAPPSIGRRS